MEFTPFGWDVEQPTKSESEGRIRLISNASRLNYTVREFLRQYPDV
jgi:hypothetical protein